MVKDYHLVTKWNLKKSKMTFLFFKSDSNDNAMIIILPQYIVHYFDNISQAMEWAGKLRKL